MNIGFFHNDKLPLRDAGSIQSWGIVSNLLKNNKIYAPSFCPFPGVVKKYTGKLSALEFTKKLDILLIIIDGEFKFEKFSLLSLLRFPRIPVVWLINAPLEEEVNMGFAKNNLSFRVKILLRKLLAKFVSHAICVSDELAEYAKNNLNIKRVSVVTNGANSKLFRPYFKTETFFDNQHNLFKIMWAGDGKYRWHAIDKIVEVSKKLEKTNPDILFVLFTNESWFEIPTLKNLLVLKNVQHEDLPKYLKSADMFLSLYHLQDKKKFYGSPMKLFDYMSMGKTVLANNRGQMSKIITNNVNGILLDSLNTDLIIDKIKLIKSNKKLATSLGNAARKSVVKVYNWENVSKKIEAILLKEKN